MAIIGILYAFQSMASGRLGSRGARATARAEVARVGGFGSVMGRSTAARSVRHPICPQKLAIHTLVRVCSNTYMYHNS